jgi:hypothetical protein
MRGLGLGLSLTGIVVALAVLISRTVDRTGTTVDSTTLTVDRA